MTLPIGNAARRAKAVISYTSSDSQNKLDGKLKLWLRQSVVCILFALSQYYHPPLLLNLWALRVSHNPEPDM